PGYPRALAHEMARGDGCGRCTLLPLLLPLPLPLPLRFARPLVIEPCLQLPRAYRAGAPDRLPHWSSCRRSAPYGLVLNREGVDAAARRGDPVRHLAGLVHRVHERADVGAVGIARQPAVAMAGPLLAAHRVPFRVVVVVRVDPLAAVETYRRQADA